MNREDSLHQLIDSAGSVLAHGLNGLTESGRLAIADELEKGTAELVIRMNPALASINASLALKDSEILLFSVGPQAQ